MPLTKRYKHTSKWYSRDKAAFTRAMNKRGFQALGPQPHALHTKDPRKDPQPILAAYAIALLIKRGEMPHDYPVGGLTVRFYTRDGGRLRVGFSDTVKDRDFEIVLQHLDWVPAMTEETLAEAA